MLGKVTDLPSLANATYTRGPLRSTTPGQQVGRASLGTLFHLFFAFVFGTRATEFLQRRCSENEVAHRQIFA